MSATQNNTLPAEWSDSITYVPGKTVSYLGIIYKCIKTSLNNNPALDYDYEYWMPLDIYMKTFTVMPHDNYSGEANMWQRDNIYIDVNGYVYINNENTGINVKGRDGQTEISFDQLTPSQIEQIRGPQGYTGPQGPKGDVGPQGPAGYVSLTEEQVALLKGADGKSTYDIWLEHGHTGTEEDFLSWVQGQVLPIDNELSSISHNAVANYVLTLAFNAYRNKIDALVRSYENRIADLENRLKYTYNGEDYLFKYGVTTDGKQGYFIHETNQIIPFNNIEENNLVTNLVPNTLNTFISQPTIDNMSNENNSPIE